MGKYCIREYRIWKGMKSRCKSPSFSKSSYQHKNIKVCDRWINSFDNFYQDMGECPENYSLDRIDNDKDYTPDNCRWANYNIQSNNRGDFNIAITYNGDTKTLKEWALYFNIKYTTLYNRIFRSNLPFEKAILPDPFNKLILYNNELHTLKEWSIILNIKYSVLVDRKFQGWDTHRMFTTPIKIINN